MTTRSAKKFTCYHEKDNIRKIFSNWATEKKKQKATNISYWFFIPKIPIITQKIRNKKTTTGNNHIFFVTIRLSQKIMQIVVTVRNFFIEHNRIRNKCEQSTNNRSQEIDPDGSQISTKESRSQGSKRI